MYEELLPLWKDLCRRIQTGEVKPMAGLARGDPWVAKVFIDMGFRWQWVGDGYRDMLVGGIMIFTWEQGIAE